VVPNEPEEGPNDFKVMDGGPGQSRTADQRFRNSPTPTDSKQLQQDDPAKRGKPEQNPQTIRKQKGNPK
jgi:hypothetical protein